MIGIILLVAITVILAAVVTTFALGIGENAEVGAQASFEFEYHPNTGDLTVTHQSGDDLDADKLRFAGAYIGDTSYGGTPFTDLVTSGDSVTINVKQGEDLRIIWKSDKEEETSVVLAEFTVPDEGKAVASIDNIDAGGANSDGKIEVDVSASNTGNSVWVVVDDDDSSPGAVSDAQEAEGTHPGDGSTVTYQLKGPGGGSFDPTTVGHGETITVTVYETSSKNNQLAQDTATVP